MKRRVLDPREQLEQLAILRDDESDTSDIQELTEEQLREAKRGQMYRRSSPEEAR
jgi:hypothetical protein